jgi:hypothetical protein
MCAFDLFGQLTAVVSVIPMTFDVCEDTVYTELTPPKTGQYFEKGGKEEFQARDFFLFLDDGRQDSWAQRVDSCPAFI